MTARLAAVLRVPLAELLGEQTPAGVYARPEHAGLARVRAALVAVPPAPAGDAGELLAALRSDVAAAWRLRSVSGRDRSDPPRRTNGRRLISGTAAVSGLGSAAPVVNCHRSGTVQWGPCRQSVVALDPHTFL
jgi:hypothetical protein